MDDDTREDVEETEDSAEAPEDSTEDAPEAAAPEPAPSPEFNFDQLSTQIAELSELVKSVVGTFASRAVDDGAVIAGDTVDDVPEVTDEPPASPYDRDYLI